jgi:hypothetical protein
MVLDNNYIQASVTWYLAFVPLRVSAFIFFAILLFILLNQSKILIAVEGELREPNPEATYDLDTALKSLKKLTQYDIKKVICFH